MRMFHKCQSLFLRTIEKSGKRRKILCYLLFLFLLVLATPVFAADIEIYTNSYEGVEPNVLIMFDNSGSMDEEIQAYFYDPTVTYQDHLGIDPNTVYYYSRGSWDRIFKNSTADISCVTARTALETKGFFNGRIRWNGTCGGWQKRYLRTGNYRNYLVEIGGDEWRRKLDIAKEIVRDFVMTTYGIRMGAMIFNYSEGGRLKHPIQDMTDDNRQALSDSIAAIGADTWTPLAETLYEAGLYFRGEASFLRPRWRETQWVQF